MVVWDFENEPEYNVYPVDTELHTSWIYFCKRFFWLVRSFKWAFVNMLSFQITLKIENAYMDTVF